MCSSCRKRHLSQRFKCCNDTLVEINAGKTEFAEILQRVLFAIHWVHSKVKKSQFDAVLDVDFEVALESRGKLSR